MVCWKLQISSATEGEPRSSHPASSFIFIYIALFRRHGGIAAVLGLSPGQRAGASLIVLSRLPTAGVYLAVGTGSRASGLR